MRHFTPRIYNGTDGRTSCLLYDDLDFVVGVDNNLIRLFKCANGMRRGPLVHRDDILLTEVVKTGMLGLVHVVDVSADEPGNYRYDLWGCKTTVTAGRDLSRLTVDSIPSAALRRSVEDAYTEVKKRGRPVLTEVHTDTSDSLLAYRRLLVPMTDDGRNVSHLLVGSIPNAPEVAA